MCIYTTVAVAVCRAVVIFTCVIGSIIYGIDIMPFGQLYETKKKHCTKYFHIKTGPKQAYVHLISIL